MKPTGTLLRNSRKEVTVTRIGLTLLLMQEIKAYFGLHILMGTNQLPSVDMYWSQNKFISNNNVAKFMMNSSRLHY